MATPVPLFKPPTRYSNAPVPPKSSIKSNSSRNTTRRITLRNNVNEYTLPKNSNNSFRNARKGERRSENIEQDIRNTFLVACQSIIKDKTLSEEAIIDINTGFRIMKKYIGRTDVPYKEYQNAIRIIRDTAIALAPINRTSDTYKQFEELIKLIAKNPGPSRSQGSDKTDESQESQGSQGPMFFIAGAGMLATFGIVSTVIITAIKAHLDSVK